MEPSIFSFISRYSWKQQLLILALTVLSFPPLYYSLELPKVIINEALGGQQAFHSFLGFELTQVDYLFALCGMFLALVLISGMLKYVINVYAGIVAERMLRRLRYQLYERMLRFPLPHFRKVSQGELVQMINAETEALGGFVGAALSVPAFQGGTLITILAFMFAQDPVLGLAAIALYPIQAYLIPKIQAQVNQLGKRRVQQVRRNAERISETVTGVRDIRGQYGMAYEQSRFSRQLGEVFWIRFEIYKKKFLIKFINNFLAQLGPFFFFSIGGYLVIQGNITLGALVAVVGAHKDLSAPWKELLTYYQTLFDVKIKYEQTVSQFSPPGTREDDGARAGDAKDGHANEPLTGEMQLRGITLVDDGMDTILDDVSFSAELPGKIALSGNAASGLDDLALIMGGLLQPTRGRVTIGERDLAHISSEVLGRRIGYVGYPSYIFNGTIAENLTYGLLREPADEKERNDKSSQLERSEAEKSGNSLISPDAPWVEWQRIGADTPEARLHAMVAALEIAGLDEDVYAFGLRGQLDEDPDEALVASLLEARAMMRARLAEDEKLLRLVEPFDPERYNDNATLAENLLFGLPIGETFDTDNLASQPYLVRVLDEAQLTEQLRRTGFELAQMMVEIFADLPPDHEFFQQFSFISSDQLVEYKRLLGQAEAGRLDRLAKADRDRLLSLPFKLISARHRLGLIDDDLRARIIAARKKFRAGLPDDLRPAIAFFEPDSFNRQASIQDNILFGRIAYGQANAPQRMAELITGIIDEMGLRERVMEVGLQAACGVGGGRLSSSQRQKLAIARTVLKGPDILIMHDSFLPFDTAEQVRIRDNVLAFVDTEPRRTLICSIPQDNWSACFDLMIKLEKGRVCATSNPTREPVQEQELEAS